MINKLIVSLLQLMPKRFVWIFSKRYIAGEGLEDALKITGEFNSKGMLATMDLLGEFLTRPEKVESYKEEYIRLIDESVKRKLDNSFSVKPTMFGLLIDEEMCYNNIRDIVSRAALNRRFVRIDMEDSQCTDREISLYKRLLGEFPGNVGLVLQSYLKRTMNDLNNLAEFDNGRGLVNIRICKGIYNEASSIAFKSKKEININFLKAIDFMFRNKIYAAVATHDREIINGTLKLINEHKISSGEFEFQMLYGVTPDLGKSLVEKGYTLRIYVPYGKDWFNYSTRRLKENPRMVFHIVKALFVRG